MPPRWGYGVCELVVVLGVGTRAGAWGGILLGIVSCMFTRDALIYEECRSRSYIESCISTRGSRMGLPYMREPRSKAVDPCC